MRRKSKVIALKNGKNSNRLEQYFGPTIMSHDPSINWIYFQFSHFVGGRNTL